MNIDNEAVRAAVPLIAEVYKHHLAGGALHIVLDDWNLEDQYLSFCAEHIGEYDSTPEQQNAERKCLKAFQELTLDERERALELYDQEYPA
jgi:hypothetical protein